ncbi:PREDICTED: oocyte-secreted protein 2 [Elephantulus edwardii]|uniref:oocyte-secreted protein 2 n=1 Tax=Elephantulus edwardii TaxID=28737 RepID=UPI0003F05C7C|nr:PREDICTED: oocyte-secreted protein 2 [Elephantulus edwardii]
MTIRASEVWVKINCSIDWLMVTVCPVADNYTYVFADELFLGLGCPPTWIQTYAYDFVYRVNDCGIRTMVLSKDTVMFQSEIKFIPRNKQHACQIIPLECLPSRKSPWLKPVSTEDEIKVDPSPFSADFMITPEELGLLAFQNGFQNGSSSSSSGTWKLGKEEKSEYKSLPQYLISRKS